VRENDSGATPAPTPAAATPTPPAPATPATEAPDPAVGGAPVDAAATGGSAAATGGSETAADGSARRPGGLSPRDAMILEFEARWWRTPGAKDQAIRDTFGLSATRYYQALNRLLDSPAALATDPVLLGRLRRLREGRRGARGEVFETSRATHPVGPEPTPAYPDDPTAIGPPGDGADPGAAHRRRASQRP
jgi:Protein of unknown function (DUF3263)